MSYNIFKNLFSKILNQLKEKEEQNFEYIKNLENNLKKCINLNNLKIIN